MWQEYARTYCIIRPLVRISRNERLHIPCLYSAPLPQVYLALKSEPLLVYCWLRCTRVPCCPSYSIMADLMKNPNPLNVDYTERCKILTHITSIIPKRWKIPQNYKLQNGKECKGKTIYAQSAVAQRVRQNFLADGRLTNSPPPPPHTLHPLAHPCTDLPNWHRDRV